MFDFLYIYRFKYRKRRFFIIALSNDVILTYSHDKNIAKDVTKYTNIVSKPFRHTQLYKSLQCILKWFCRAPGRGRMIFFKF